MMGKRVMAEPLFYTFRLEDHVPVDHPLRAVDVLLDTAFIRRVMAPYYSAIGHPSIDPELGRVDGFNQHQSARKTDDG